MDLSDLARLLRALAGRRSCRPSAQDERASEWNGKRLDPARAADRFRALLKGKRP